ncbi:histidinol-phosphate transaminase [Leucobacter sp. HY1910]
MQVHLRQSLTHVPPYRQGKQPLPGASKLSSNESPHPPLPAVVQAVAAQLDGFHRYPDIAALPVRTLLADRLGVDVERVTLGAGSVEVAAQLIHAVTDPGDEVMFAWRSFEAYPSLVRIAGAIPVEVPLDEQATHNLDAMLAAITPRTRLIFICNPNNPTGTVVGAAELEAFVAAVPHDVLVVIDEAYVHFDRTPDRADGIDLFMRHPHVAVLHTFSKAYGLAGLRIGYAVSPPHVAEALRKVAVPFGVTSLAQAAAIASLEAETELAARIDEVVAQRGRMFDALQAARLDPVPSQANFVWVPDHNAAGVSAVTLGALFETHGAVARVFAGEGVRISSGGASDIERVVRALETVTPALAR